jgi:hypothetical protein
MPNGRSPLRGAACDLALLPDHDAPSDEGVFHAEADRTRNKHSWGLLWAIPVCVRSGL